MAEDYKLIDNEEKHRYEFQIDGKIAEIDYIKSNNIDCLSKQSYLNILLHSKKEAKKSLFQYLYLVFWYKKAVAFANVSGLPISIRCNFSFK